jgi:hypothetical protein
LRWDIGKRVAEQTVVGVVGKGESSSWNEKVLDSWYQGLLNYRIVLRILIHPIPQSVDSVGYAFESKHL